MRRRPKKADSVPKLVLEEVIGLTTRNANGLASDVSSGRCAYLAGCVVVLYDVGTGARKHLMVSSRAPKPLSCVALSRQGRNSVAAGESGHVPAILIWDSSTGNLLSELKCHQCGVQSIDFSSDGKSLVSLGYLNDGYICLWDWRAGRLISKVKSSTSLGPILCVSFLSEGCSFITVGRKHVKLWTPGFLKALSTNVGKELSSLDGKAANLASCKGSSFISVACAAFSTKTAASDQVVDSFPLYALTETGILCVLDRGISVEKNVDLKVEKGFALSVSENLIACACNSGIVQLFCVPSLIHVGRLDYGKPNGQLDLTNMSSHSQPSEPFAEHSDTTPDAIACQFLSPTKLAVIYADHSFYIWDIDHIHKISKCCLLVAHSACIWDVQNLPCKNLSKIDANYESSGYPTEVSMATCSADGTIRLWDLILHPPPEGKHEQTHITLNQRIYNSVDNELASSVQLASCGILEQEHADKVLLAKGFRCMAVSSDGQYVAAGDFRGNLHVFNLHTSAYTCIEEAHDAEILSVNFSNKQAGNNAELDGPFFLVTGSRDRTVHVHNIRRSFDLIESFEDHSAPVTSAILTWNGCKLLSCSADRSILFRDIIITDSGCKLVRRHNQIACHGTIYDMAIDRARKLVVTVGQDKRINKYSLSSGKLVASFKEEGDPGQPIKVTIDPSGSYILSSYSNKSLRIYDIVTGELVGQAMGHAEVVTGSIFLPNCRHIVSVSGDSCIFIWKLPALLSSKMLQKNKENAGCPPTTVATKSTTTLEIAQQKVESVQPNVDSDYCMRPVMSDKEDRVVDDGSGEDSKFMFSISRLPKWAQTNVGSKPVMSQDSDSIVSGQLSSPQSSNLEIVDGHVPSVGSSFCGDPTKNAPSDQNILSCSSEGRIVHFDDIVDLDETDSPEGHCSDTKSFDSFLNLSEELLVEECSGYDVIDTISFDATANESLTTLSVPEHSKISSGRAELNEEGSNAIKERHEDGFFSQVVEKVLPKRLDTNEKPVHSRAAAIGGFTNELPCDDLFSQHFDNLSTVLKPEGRSSKRKSLSSHFRVRRDCLSSCKRLSLAATENHFQAPCADLGSPLDPLRSVEDAPQQDTFSQEKNNNRRLPLSTTRFPREMDIVHLIDTPPSEISNPPVNGDQMPGSSERDEMPREIDECREALHRLDEAAETALGLCTKLGVLEVTGSQSDGCRTELLALMAGTLPSIMEKIQILANLGQSGKEISGSICKPEGLDIEPMIERFAESLSHRVLELLKTKL